MWRVCHDYYAFFYPPYTLIFRHTALYLIYNSVKSELGVKPELVNEYFKVKQYTGGVFSAVSTGEGGIETERWRLRRGTRRKRKKKGGGVD
jgi:hypothetical protein